MNNKNMSNLVVPGAKQAIEKMKYEIANELGVTMGPNATSRANGSVGGEITKRLVQIIMLLEMDRTLLSFFNFYVKFSKIWK